MIARPGWNFSRITVRACAERGRKRAQARVRSKLPPGLLVEDLVAFLTASDGASIDWGIATASGLGYRPDPLNAHSK